MNEHNFDETHEEMLTRLEGVANFMRGVMLDPSVPNHVKSALKSKTDEIDEYTEVFNPSY